MSTLEEFRRHLLDRRQEFEAWGRFVVERVRRDLNPAQVSLQIVSSRAKEIESAIGKIARKNYKDPLRQMTDLVGVRFVVLISPQIDSIASIVEGGGRLGCNTGPGRRPRNHGSTRNVWLPIEALRGA